MIDTHMSITTHNIDIHSAVHHRHAQRDTRIDIYGDTRKMSVAIRNIDTPRNARIDICRAIHVYGETRKTSACLMQYSIETHV